MTRTTTTTTGIAAAAAALLLAASGSTVAGLTPGPPDTTGNPVNDAGVAILFGPTAIEAAWAPIRYAVEPGLALILSDLYPLT